MCDVRITTKAEMKNCSHEWKMFLWLCTIHNSILHWICLLFLYLFCMYLIVCAVFYAVNFTTLIKRKGKHCTNIVIHFDIAMLWVITYDTISYHQIKPLPTCCFFNNASLAPWMMHWCFNYEHKFSQIC